jgi:6-phosphogluconolactonase
VHDLGQDKVLIYKSDLTPAEPAFASIKAGSGPRHLVAHPKGNAIYVMSEMGSTITVLSRDNMTELQVISTLPKDFSGKSAGAEIQIHPSGKFVYASNRFSDTIAVFAADAKGLLKLVENVPTQGKTPRGFVLDPTGHWLILGNQDSDTMVIFKVNQSSGKLTPAGSPIEIGSPVAFAFVPLGK